MSKIPFVAIGHGEEVPWGNDRSCPTCGEPDLPLLDSDPPGLHYIKHCGGVWLRGPLSLNPPQGLDAMKRAAEEEN